MSNKNNFRTFEEFNLSLLSEPDDAEIYLKVALEEYKNDGDTKAFLLALKSVAEAQGGIAKLAKKSTINRQNLYKLLNGKTEPKLTTFLKIMDGLNVELDFHVRNILGK
ncbi:MAG: helix-turn-helix domain-containing protein [Alphaproteobacteria bacterium]|nr:helix-turn-helix domain-containing protein [Alphaproteobacteria bacterium]OJV12578.1 MAG: hypothetical protein BGO27_03525 [Alphaproteobacteria bacterium 33-17]